MAPPRALSQEHEARAAELYREGWSVQQIAYRFHVARSTVQLALKRQGVVLNRTPQQGRELARTSSFEQYRRSIRPAYVSLINAVSGWSRNQGATQ